MNQSPKTILVVEDEQKIADVLQDYLKASNYETVHIDHGDAVMGTLNALQPDLVILDVMLPGKDGLELCREIRQISTVPIVMITARVEEIDRLLGLELGADDYICKPFSPREVVIRVRNILRRVDIGKHNEQVSDGDPIKYRGIELSFDRQQCITNGMELVLTSVEFRMLYEMARHPGIIYSRDSLMSIAYQDGRVVTDRTIDTHIKNIRKKFRDVLSDTELIHSIYGRGYKVE